LNDYVNEADPNFKWHHTGTTFKSFEGGTVHVLNITSIQWRNDTDYKIEHGGSIWTHEVAVIVPRDLETTNMASIYLASAKARCNSDSPLKDSKDFDLEMGDIISADTRAVSVVAYMNPNCPMVFPDDP